MALRWPWQKKPASESSNYLEQLPSSWRTYPADGLKANHLRTIMRNADIGETAQLMELLDDVANDPHIGSQLRTRKLTVAAAEWSVEPFCDRGSEKPKLRDQKIADDCQEFLETIPCLKQLRMDALERFYRGFALIQPRLEYVNGKLRVVDWQAIESRFLRFDQMTGEPLVMTLNNQGGEPIPAGAWWTEWRDKPGPVVRGGIGRSLVKLWMYKSYALIDCASYLERFGHPHVQVTAPKGVTEKSKEMERIKDAAKSMLADLVGIVPEGTRMELIESMAKAGTIRDMYLAKMDWLDRQASRAILHQTLTMGRTEGPGGYADAKIAQEETQEIKDSDAADQAEFETGVILAQYMAQKYGPDVPVPTVCLDVSTPENQLDVSQAQYYRAQSLEILQRMGMDLSRCQIREEYELEEPKAGKENDVLVSATPAPVGPPTAPADKTPAEPTPPMTPPAA